MQLVYLSSVCVWLKVHLATIMVDNSDTIRAACLVTENGRNSDWASTVTKESHETAESLIKKFLVKLLDIVGEY